MGTELVITQEAHVAAEFAIEVKIENTAASAQAREEARLVAEHWGAEFSSLPEAPVSSEGVAQQPYAESALERDDVRKPEKEPEPEVPSSSIASTSAGLDVSTDGGAGSSPPARYSPPARGDPEATPELGDLRSAEASGVRDESLLPEVSASSSPTDTSASTASPSQPSAATRTSTASPRQSVSAPGSELANADIGELSRWAQSRFKCDLIWESPEEQPPFYRAAITLGGRRFEGDLVKGKSAAKASCLLRARAETP